MISILLLNQHRHHYYLQCWAVCKTQSTNNGAVHTKKSVWCVVKPNRMNYPGVYM